MQSIPHCCALCHAVCVEGLCPDCKNRYFAAALPRCRQCAHTLPESGESLICGSCLKQPPAFDQTIAVTDYTPPVDQLVLAFKFGGALALAPLFARMLQAAMQRHPADFTRPDVLVPVPLAPGRLASRGFNQAHEIARPLSRQLGIALMPRLIKRIRETVPQTEIALRARRSNIRGAFAISEGGLPAVKGRHIALVDDVLTSGETVGELARMLKAAGAASVSCLIVARTPL
ncbi:MAG: ComF family protein [Burkholderiaceae bacterium]|nr:ComF family protein [Burkholderiaceae bacterium]